MEASLLSQDHHTTADSTPMTSFSKKAALYHERIPGFKRLPLPVVGVILCVVLVNILVWVVVGIIFALPQYNTTRALVSTAVLAYVLGLCHALDADHISAIDLTTRRLVAAGQRPVTIGMLFSLGHSTIVIIISIIVAATAAVVRDKFDKGEAWQLWIFKYKINNFANTFAFIRYFSVACQASVAIVFLLALYLNSQVAMPVIHELINISTIGRIKMDIVSSFTDPRQPIRPPGKHPTAKPRVTSSNSQEYCRRLAEITSRACLLDPFNILLQQETAGAPIPVTLESLYGSAMKRIETKVGLGCSVVEADNFAAVACLEPPSAALPELTEIQLDEMAKERPIYSQFNRDYQAARVECLGNEQKHWKLSLMARDPERTSKGAVRVIIERYTAKAKKEGVPIWLVAGNEHARDVYAYFGFRVVKLLWSGQDNLAVPTWCMVFNWPPELSPTKVLGDEMCR